MKIPRIKLVLLLRTAGIIILASFFMEGFVLPIYRHYIEANDIKTIEKNAMYFKEYISFFRKDVIPDMQLHNNFSARSKSNYIVLSYKGVDIYLHRVDLSKQKSMSDLIGLKRVNSKSSYDVIYAGTEDGSFRFLYLLKGRSLVENVLITFEDKLLGDDRSNNLANISLQTNSVALKFAKDDSFDMVWESIDQDRLLRVNLVVLNRKQYAFILVAVTGETERELSHSFLKDLIDPQYY